VIVARELLDIAPRRQRKNITPKSIGEMRDAILSLGILLHAPVVQAQENGRFLLIAGERRTRAIDQIATDKKTFIYDKVEVAPGHIPVTLLSELMQPDALQEVELIENTGREELPWQDKIEALAYIHQLRKTENPKQTVTATARELAAKVEAKEVASGAPASIEGLRSEVAFRKNLGQALIISQHLDRPEIAKARNATEAFNLIIANEEKRFTAELILRGNKKSSLIEVRHGSLLEIMPKLDAGLFDTICSDPPYGIGVNSAGFRSRTVHHHNYDDSPDYTRSILGCILTEGFRVTKPRANLFLFCDVDFFGWLKEAALRAGWDPFRTPITWQKSKSEGLAPWGREGFRRTTEWIFFARKGQKGLHSSPVDVLDHSRVSRDEREYGPEKPVPLLRQLLECSTLPGDRILDPCCGSGSTLEAAKSLNMAALGIEVDEKAFNIALVKSQMEAGSPLKEGLDAL
jgi:DNA modification methylase/ParB-like chromosome segregation protein Spo0J